MEIGYCTILSKYRLFQGISLYNSIKSNTKSFKIYTLCVDDVTYNVLKKLELENLTPILLEEIEDESLLEVKQERSIDEYCYTIKPWLMLYIFNQYPSIEVLYLLDSDIYFYTNPVKILEELRDCSILLSRHDFYTDSEIQCSMTGKYNAGICIFKKDSISLTALQWWKQKCRNWCYLRIEDGKFADQKYLEDLPIIFKGVCEIRNPGVNVAFWNQPGREITEKEGHLYINCDELVCYHFSGFRMLNSNEYVLNFGKSIYIEILHQPYSKEVRNTMLQVEALGYLDTTKFLYEDTMISQVSIERYLIESDDS